MARVTHVKKAQQRYETVPVIDPATGEQKKTPVMKTRKVFNEITEEYDLVSEQKKTKRGSLVFMSVTTEDRSKPKDPYTCDFCHLKIEVGTPYKHITPKSGPYGGRKRTRHESCPTWQVWEYSSSMSAELARIAHDFEQALDSCETPDDVTSALEDAATEIESLAEQKHESAQNIEDGFGHPTSASEELESTAESLESWAEEVTSVDVPELPEPEERWYVTNGDGVPSDLFEEDGYDSESEAQQALDMQREDDAETDTDEPDDGFEVESITPEDPTEEQVSEWRDEVRDACSIVDESPV